MTGAAAPGRGPDAFVARACVTSYLRRVRAMDDEIRETEERIRAARERLEAVGAAGGGPGSGARGDRIGDGVARVMELEREWSERVSANLAEIAAAQDMCSPRHPGRWAMWMHVVERRTWAGVGAAMGYSAVQARRIADAGARELYRLIPEQYRRDEFPNAAPL